MATPVPDFAWYAALSQQRGVAPRCPFANVHRCPGYYQSVWLIGECTGATQIDPEQDRALRLMWEASDLWPVTGEQTPSVSGVAGASKTYMNFCPEAAYERFGLFAADLSQYTDEVDVAVTHAKLDRESAPHSDWRWAWEYVHPLHFTERPLYSLLLHPETRRLPDDRAAKRPDRVLDVRPTLWGITLDVNSLLARIRAWWSRRVTSRRKA